MFEKKTNLKMQIQTEDSDNEWMKSMLDKMAAFKVDEFSLSFNKDASLYQHEKEVEQKGFNFSFGSAFAAKNKVYTEFPGKKVIAQKSAYENNYLITDTIQHYDWKIEDEMRPIAGYLCRKAVTTIDDSVVVVAFYTVDIMVSGGPEGMNGLPGMILGLAIPRLYTTWFAMSVELGPQEIAAFKPEKKSNHVNRDEFLEDLKKGTKDWGKNSAKLLWWAML